MQLGHVHQVFGRSARPNRLPLLICLQVQVLRIYSLGFRARGIWDLGFQVSDLGFRVWGEPLKWG